MHTIFDTLQSRLHITENFNNSVIFDDFFREAEIRALLWVLHFMSPGDRWSASAPRIFNALSGTSTVRSAY